MTTTELIQSWRQTERYLMNAKAILIPVVVAEYIDSLNQFDDFLSHNGIRISLR